MAHPALLWIALALANLLASPAAGCYRVPDIDLWEAMAAADAVVVAEVVSVEPALADLALEFTKNAIESTAKLVGTAWWDGQLLLEQAADAVPYPPGRWVVGVTKLEDLVAKVPSQLRVTGDCAGPARIGSRLVLFLERGPFGWRVVTKTWGAQHLARGEDLGDLRVAVAAAEALLQGRPTAAAVREWLVLASALPGTRRLALPRLHREGGLSVEHAGLLAEVFLAEPPMARELPRWLELFADHPNARIDEHAAATVEGARAQQPEYGWEDSARAVLGRLGVHPAKPPCPTDLDRRRFHELWASVVEREWPHLAAP